MSTASPSIAVHPEEESGSVFTASANYLAVDRSEPSHCLSLLQDEKAELSQHFFIGHVLQPSIIPRSWPSTALVPIYQHYTSTGEPQTGHCTPDALAWSSWLCSCQYNSGCFWASLLQRHTAALCSACLLLWPPDPFLQSYFLHSQTPAFESGSPANFLYLLHCLSSLQLMDVVIRLWETFRRLAKIKL